MSLVATLKNWVLRGRADEAQVPEVQVLPDGRKRLTRRVKLANHTGAPDWLSVPYGTLDAEAAPAEWENLRLVGKALSDAPTPGGRDTSPMLVLIYETLIAPGETPVGEWKRVRLEDGRDAWSREWLQLLTETATPATVGAVYVVPAGTAYLQREEASPDAELGLRRIVRTCVTSGVLEIDTQTRNNGALVIKRITSAVTVPTTPAGFVLIGEPVQNPNGLPTYTYTFAKGDGLVSEQIAPLGTGLSRVTWVSLGTRLVPPGIELPGGATAEEDGYQRHTVSSLQGLSTPGETPVGEWKRVRLEDGRDAWSREWLQLLSETATPATVGVAYPATAIVEGVATYLQREEASPDAELGLRRIVRTVATAGRVMESMESMEYGLRRVTWTCLGAEQTPTGVRVARRVQNVLGFPEFTVTCMQSPSGGDPAGYSFSFNRPVALTYPGRIKAYTTGVSGSSKVLAGAFMSPPVELSVVGTCEVSYSTSPTAYFGTLYSPTMWATVEAKHLSRYGTPVATLEGKRGFIADGGTHQVEVTAPVFMDDVNSGGSIFGKLVYGGSTGYIRVSGGVDPKGSTYTISADNDPVFVDLAGVTYYRHVVVTAAFPSDIPDLPQAL